MHPTALNRRSDTRFIMNKKADMSINTIVAAALALILLIILIFVFKGQIGNLAKGFTTTGDEAKLGATQTKCRAMFTDRACESDLSKFPEYTKTGSALPKPCKKYKPDPVTKKDSQECLDVGWIDCGNSDCYEIVKKST